MESIGLIDSIENHDDDNLLYSGESTPSEKISESEIFDDDEDTDSSNETDETVNNPNETDETVNNPSETDETLPDINTEEEIDEIELENANQKIEQNDTIMLKYKVQEKTEIYIW